MASSQITNTWIKNDNISKSANYELEHSTIYYANCSDNSTMSRLENELIAKYQPKYNKVGLKYHKTVLSKEPDWIKYIVPFHHRYEQEYAAINERMRYYKSSSFIQGILLGGKEPDLLTISLSKEDLFMLTKTSGTTVCDENTVKEAINIIYSKETKDNTNQACEIRR